jgi:hypothetical protein
MNRGASLRNPHTAVQFGIVAGPYVYLGEYVHNLKKKSVFKKCNGHISPAVKKVTSTPRLDRYRRPSPTRRGGV